MGLNQFIMGNIRSHIVTAVGTAKKKEEQTAGMDCQKRSTCLPVGMTSDSLKDSAS
jgi:hypothetical protein